MSKKIEILSQEEQLLLLNLFAASVMYVNAKLEDRNPFVKPVMGETISEQQAFGILVNACNDLAQFIPLLSMVDSAIEKMLSETTTVENKEVNDAPNDLGTIPIINE
jgi:hypothetical protein